MQWFVGIVILVLSVLMISLRNVDMQPNLFKTYPCAKVVLSPLTPRSASNTQLPVLPKSRKLLKLDSITVDCVNAVDPRFSPVIEHDYVSKPLSQTETETDNNAILEVISDVFKETKEKSELTLY